MKTAILLSAFLAASPASAQNFNCTQMGAYTNCRLSGGFVPGGFAGGFAEGFARSASINAEYAAINAYREANGLPRCHWGLIGLFKSAADGLPMC